MKALTTKVEDLTAMVKTQAACTESDIKDSNDKDNVNTMNHQINDAVQLYNANRKLLEATAASMNIASIEDPVKDTKLSIVPQEDNRSTSRVVGLSSLAVVELLVGVIGFGFLWTMDFPQMW